MILGVTVPIYVPLAVIAVSGAIVLAWRIARSRAAAVDPLTLVATGAAAALRIAKDECERRGWWWVEPAKVWRRGAVWYVLSGAGGKGCNGSFKIDGTTGGILMAGFAPL